MSTEQSDDELREFSDYIDNLVEHSDGIYELREEIYEVFDMEFSENNRETDFEGFFSRIDMVFAAKIDEDNRGHTSEALINAVSQIERQDERELREQREEYELAEVLRTLKRRYGEEVTRRIKRKYQGNRWWSNIKTDPKFRGGKPAFTHEITIDTNEIIEIDNDVSNAITLANHFVTQVKNAKETHGDDAYNHIRTDQMESLIDNAENTLEKIKESKGITEEEKGEEDIHTEPDEQ